MTATLPILSPLFFPCCVLLILCSSVSFSMLPICFLFFFFCWRCWLLQYVVFLLHLSQDHKCVLAVWSLGATCIHFVTHLGPESADCICAYLWIYYTARSCVCFCWCHCSVLCHFSDIRVHLCASFCVWEHGRPWSRRACVLFMDCKEVLSVSMWAAEWLELVKPFSSPWSNPGDCCVDATLTAITDKFRRL